MLTESVQMILTPRWFELPEVVKHHFTQRELKLDLDQKVAQFFTIAAGRRSFKTERFLKRRYVRIAMENENEVIGIGAPTWSQAKLIFWEDLKNLSPSWAVAHTSDSELWIRFQSGSEIRLVGLKEFSRIEGARWTRFGITEYQKCDPRVFTQTIEPILNDTNGEGIFEGRPLGRNHFYELCGKAKTDPKRWKHYSWKSSEILSAEQIHSAQEDLAAEDYLREYDASFDADSQRVYYAYSGANHAKKEIQYEIPLIVTCDFNAGEKPMSWVVGQRVGDEVYWMKCLSFTYTNTQRMCELLDEYFRSLKKYPKRVRFYGDYSGKKHTSNSSYSDWEIIEDFFRNRITYFEKKIKPCLDIRDRNAATNARLCNTLGARRMFIDPDNCKPLAKDWEMVQRMPNGIDLDGGDPNRTHSSDAVDYYSDFDFPVKGYGTVYQQH